MTYIRLCDDCMCYMNIVDVGKLMNRPHFCSVDIDYTIHTSLFVSMTKNGVKSTIDKVVIYWIKKMQTLKELSSKVVMTDDRIKYDPIASSDKRMCRRSIYRHNLIPMDVLEQLLSYDNDFRTRKDLYTKPTKGLLIAMMLGYTKSAIFFLKQASNDYEKALDETTFQHDDDPEGAKSAVVEEWSNFLETTMYKASQSGQLEIVELLINKYGAKDYSQCLDVACERGHTDTAKYLLSYVDSISEFALYNASVSGDIDIVRSLLAKDAPNPNYALEGAAERGHTEIVKLLIKKRRATDYHNAAIAACKNGHIDIVRLMLIKGANDFNDYLYSIACHTYFVSYDDHFDIIDILLAKGATNLDEALIGAYENDHFEIVDRLIYKGATVTVNDLFIRACSSGDHDKFFKLLKYYFRDPSSIRQVYLNDWLCKASSNGSLAIVQRLLDLGANDLNKALSFADQYGNYDTMVLLIARGANDCNGEAFKRACRQHYDSINKTITLFKR